MTIARRLGAVGAVLTLAGTGVAAATPAPTVGAQKTWTGATAPLTILGTGVHRGERIPKGDRIVYRDVTVGGREVVNFALRAPAGKRIRGVMPADPPAPPEVNFLVTNVRPKGHHTADRYYPGGTIATIRARAYPTGSASVTERIYALAS